MRWGEVGKWKNRYQWKNRKIIPVHDTEPTKPVYEVSWDRPSTGHRPDGLVRTVGLSGPGNEFHSDGELARVVVQAAPAISAAEEQFSVP